MILIIELLLGRCDTTFESFIAANVANVSANFLLGTMSFDATPTRYRGEMTIGGNLGPSFKNGCLRYLTMTCHCSAWLIIQTCTLTAVIVKQKIIGGTRVVILSLKGSKRIVISDD